MNIAHVLRSHMIDELSKLQDYEYLVLCVTCISSPAFLRLMVWGKTTEFILRSTVPRRWSTSARTQAPSQLSLLDEFTSICQKKMGF